MHFRILSESTHALQKPVRRNTSKNILEMCIRSVVANLFESSCKRSLYTYGDTLAQRESPGRTQTIVCDSTYTVIPDLRVTTRFPYGLCQAGEEDRKIIGGRGGFWAGGVRGGVKGGGVKGGRRGSKGG